MVETEQTHEVRRALSLRVVTRRSSFGLPRQVVGLKVDQRPWWPLPSRLINIKVQELITAAETRIRTCLTGRWVALYSFSRALCRFQIIPGRNKTNRQPKTRITFFYFFMGFRNDFFIWQFLSFKFALLNLSCSLKLNF